jgi:hypothetical protein
MQPIAYYPPQQPQAFPYPFHGQLPALPAPPPQQEDDEETAQRRRTLRAKAKARPEAEASEDEETAERRRVLRPKARAKAAGLRGSLSRYLQGRGKPDEKITIGQPATLPYVDYKNDSFLIKPKTTPPVV